MCTPILVHYAGHMQAEPEHDPLLSPREAAGMLGISYKTLNRAADAGKIACERAGERGDRKYHLSVISRHKHLGTFALAAEIEAKGKP